MKNGRKRVVPVLAVTLLLLLTACRSDPPTMHWPDRRVLGSVYLASSPQADDSQLAAFAGNPRRYFNDPSIDIRTSGGLFLFQQRILNQAQEVVQNLQRMKAQGVVVWDIEGEQFPQKTSYVGAPNTIAQTAPEMESIVAPGLPHAGEKLDDAWFHIVSAAGFRSGVCVRPQRFTLHADGSASQVVLPIEQVAAELIKKMRWAHARWGTTLFYVDSTLRTADWPLPSSVLRQAAAAMPDSLLIPERATPFLYGFSAPLRSFLFEQETDVPAGIRLLYPDAFAVILINDADMAKLEANRPKLIQSIRHGDIPMLHAGSWNSNNDAVLQMEREAGN